MYCSLEHKLSDDKEGHKWCCGRPPWKVPLTAREEDLCLQVFALMESSQPDSTKVEATKQRHVEEVHRSDLKEGDEGDDDDDDDEGSWESIDSNDDNQGSNSLTAVISKFFEKKVYRHQGWE
jgi:TATA-binding protein-associated factor Taf7